MTGQLRGAAAGLAGGALALLMAGTALAGPVEVVQIAGGKVQSVATDVAGVQVFKGLPYAGPAAGKARFAPPGPVVPWDGVKLADTWGDQVMQDVNLNPVGTFWGDEFYYDPEFLPPASEAGLNLNVFTPARDTGDALPVYVWIHGGGNDHGYASEIEFWAPKLAAKGILVVPVQYRVGPFGFLTTPELDAEIDDGRSGNQALKDLIVALEWVRDNIAGFGGDPGTVTIGGQSAGASNTVALLSSPPAKGLFGRAVIESTGPSLLPRNYPSIEDQQAANAAAIAEVFGGPRSLEELRAIPAAEFIDRKIGGKNLFYALDAPVSNYVIDGTFLTAESVDLLRPGALDGIDLMIGSTSDERTSTVGDPDGAMGPEEFAAAMSKVYGDGYADVYRASDPSHAYRLKLRAEADYRFASVLLSTQAAKARNSEGNVFAYYFNHAPPGRNAEFYGSYHSSDLWYFFNSIRDWDGQRPWTGADERMAETMSSYLANFVKTGDPNGEGLPDWPQPEDGPAFMRFHDGLALAAEATPWPERDALNRKQMLADYGMTEASLAP
ncbi:carboxylesterase/lipase family protein [Mangrovicoccus sp. HB161399]|uniref:carboxylesterase/lipase family protein n=1 Tax=Mangrovicoccus sp. HB161399 TaxID=2720392 RepID=UPI001553AD77|nr:carboxylesterase family protein [Mangrovicoccus sp. HB161399]